MVKRIWSILLVLCMLSGCAEQPLYPIEEDIGFMYARTQLTEDSQQDYDDMYEAFMELDESVKLKSDDEDEILNIYNSVLEDHPEIFWMEERTSSVGLNLEMLGIFTQLKPRYLFTKEEVEENQGKLEEQTAGILAGISTDASDYEKVKYVYDYIINHTDYKLMSKENQNILSVLLYQKSVCAGYAKTMQYLLERLDIDCAYLTGTLNSNDGRHAWNMVNMDGEYYYVDATSGEGKISVSGETDEYRKNYVYLAMTSDEMLTLYTPEQHYEETYATTDNYYVQQGAYFEDVDAQRILELLQQDDGTRTLSLKCRDADVYARLRSYLLDQYHMFDLLEQSGISVDQVRYVEYQELNIITFYY